MRRMTAFDTDDMLYGILTADTTLSAISGGIYVHQRPDDSTEEDIVVNTLAITREMPATATANINIHVPDIALTFRGRKQYKMNRERLRTITNQVLSMLDTAIREGVALKVTNQNIIEEGSTHQHYMNLRVEFNIQKEIN